MPGERIEQRPRLRAEHLPAETTLVVRGGRDTADKLRSHAQRTARAWSLDGQPLLGISVFAVLGMPLGCWEPSAVSNWLSSSSSARWRRTVKCGRWPVGRSSNPCRRNLATVGR